MTARSPKFRREGGFSRKSKGALLLAAIFLLAIPFLAAANSAAIQSAINPVITQVQALLLPANDAFTSNEAPAAITGGIAPLSASGIVQEATTFSAGTNYSLAIKSDGTLWAWGANGNGRTGLGTETGDQTTPAQVGTATNWAVVSAGMNHSLAIRSDGTLWAWGANQNGRTGLGTTTGNQTTPAQVGTATNWTALSTGTSHSLAIKSDGTLWAWGSNGAGRTGLGTDTGDQTTPLQVGTATNWIAVSAANAHSLALRSDGTLWSWGFNQHGQTGLGTTAGSQTTPAQVGTATNWTALTAGNNHSHAIRSDGTLWAWGLSQDGMTGLGTSTGNQQTPAQVGTVTNWTQVSAGQQHTLAIRSDGTLWAWGSNTFGRSGLGADTSIRNIPTRVGSASDWILADAAHGGAHSLAMRTNGDLWVWGYNFSGQLGLGNIGTGTERLIPALNGAGFALERDFDIPEVTVIATLPDSNVTGVTELNTTHISIFFDREMNPAVMGTITLDNGALVILSAASWRASTATDPDGDRGNNSVLTVPLVLFTSDTLHEVTVAGFECLADGEPMTEHSWTFTTGTVTPPPAVSVLAVQPSGTTVSIATNSLILTFNQEMNQAAGTVEISADPLLGRSAGATLDRENASWNTEGTEISIPLSGLEYATEYTVEIAGFTSLIGTVLTTETISFTTANEPPPPLTDLYITKHLQMPVGTITPTTEFAFEIIPHSFNYDTDQANVLPTIAVPNLTFSASDVATVTGDVRTVTKVSELLIEDKVTFPSPGLFTYRISELSDTFSNTTTETMTFDPTIYQVTFIVLPDSESGENLVNSIIVQEVLAGDTLGSKIEDLYTALTFTNTFVRNVEIDPTDPLATGGLRISKTTTGIMPDLSRAFDFDIRLTAPSLATTETPPIIYRAQIIDTETNVPIGSVIEFTDEVTRTVSLTHNQTLVFLDTHVGTRYTALELAVSDYTPHVVVHADGVIDTSIINPPERTPNVSLSTGEQTLGEAANTADFTNTDFFVPPTGLDIGKFGMALLLMAIAGLIVIVTATRRSKREMELAVLTH